ncbi:MAG: cobalamin synthesis protein P47K [Leptospiraceae bacterium]|nr:hypothetical protein [Leptospiraceae bacterium]MCP5512193.1 cobalamin synthesis protein P47K [Leptospiraceae bacterium]
MKTKLVMVGGFLGAGKTTLLNDIAQKLVGDGYKVGLITNDQAPDLVDTAYLSHGSIPVEEVSGSCFCCNFPGFLNAIDQVQSGRIADILIAEPVGSCTDLSATIIQPLKEKLSNDLIVSPLSVLTDPLRLREILDGGEDGLHPSAVYIFKKQLEEADTIVITKIDLILEEELNSLIENLQKLYPGVKIFPLSVERDKGIREWLNYALNETKSGQKLAEVDYDIYAEGEAVLGWLNATYQIQTKEKVDWKQILENYMIKISQEFENRKSAIGHIKILIESQNQFLIGNLTGSQKTLRIRGNHPDSESLKITLNFRVQMIPALLEEIVKNSLTDFLPPASSQEPLSWSCFSPARPEPSYRFDSLR